MTTSQIDLIMSQVQRLSAREQLEIIKRVADLLERVEQSHEIGNIETANGEAQKPDASLPRARELARAASLRDFTADRQWLADHRDEYAGQWVALKYGLLISHGLNAKEVHQAARDAGHLDALLVLVEPSDAPPFIL
ncbi:MAG: DUF5678 domain-containing protein [Acidobacteria bacterium]|nr:DUF5678 domain-containing protein [Acidobacteriota bacterium]